MTQAFDNRDWDVQRLQEKEVELQRMRQLVKDTGAALLHEVGDAQAEIARLKALWEKAGALLDGPVKDALLEAQFRACRALAGAVVGNQKAWNARLVWVPGDAPAVEPIGGIAPDPSERWEVCYNGTDGYDLWYVGTRARMGIVKAGLTLEEAARCFEPVEEALQPGGK